MSFCRKSSTLKVLFTHSMQYRVYQIRQKAKCVRTDSNDWVGNKRELSTREIETESKQMVFVFGFIGKMLMSTEPSDMWLVLVIYPDLNERKINVNVNRNVTFPQLFPHSYCCNKWEKKLMWCLFSWAFFIIFVCRFNWIFCGFIGDWC